MVHQHRYQHGASIRMEASRIAFEEVFVVSRAAELNAGCNGTDFPVDNWGMGASRIFSEPNCVLILGALPTVDEILDASMVADPAPVLRVWSMDVSHAWIQLLRTRGASALLRDKSTAYQDGLLLVAPAGVDVASVIPPELTLLRFQGTEASRAWTQRRG